MALTEAPSSSGRRHLSNYAAAKLDGIVIAKTGQTRIQDRVWTGFPQQEPWARGDEFEDNRRLRTAEGEHRTDGQTPGLSGVCLRVLEVRVIRELISEADGEDSNERKHRRQK